MNSTLVGYAIRSLGHHRSRALTQVLAIGAALSLLGSVTLFVSGSLGLMTASAAARVPLDWQAPATDQAAAASLAGRLLQVDRISAAAPVATASLLGTSHQLPGGVASSGAASVLAVPADYPRKFRAFHLLTGTLEERGVVLSQPLASTLQAQVGDTILLRPSAQTAPVAAVLTGVAVIDASEQLFQPLGGSGQGGAAPPSQVVIAPLGLFDPSLAGVPGAAWQVHANVSRAILTGGPAEAQQKLATFRHVVERSFPGELVISDNLDATLAVAAEQALYGEAIFIFLALPGVLIALWLAHYASLAGADDERRNAALLRTRGAGRGTVIAMATVQGLVLGVVAAAIGLLGAAAALQATGVLPGGWPPRSLPAVAGLLLVVGVSAALMARVGVVAAAYREAVAGARARMPRATRPLWARLYLDVLALAASAVVFGIDRLTGLSAVVNPDSNPTLALSLYSFLAPTLLWIGATLGLVRWGSALLAALSRRIPPVGSDRLLPFLLKSAGRRSRGIARAFILVGLLLSFGVSLGLFSATYDQQGLADARLTVGADVVVNAPPGADLTPATMDAVRRTPGVSASSAMRHTYAYVGPDLQDLFGVDVATVARATQLRDSYFPGSGTGGALRGLGSRPDALLVSAETIKDYGLNQGDLIRLRVLDRVSGQYRVIDFHVVGVVSEFPTAPKDSFLVANLKYLLGATHGAGPNVALISSADPQATAYRVRSTVATTGATTNDINHQAAVTSSSLTAISLAGISRLEEAFAILMAIVAVITFGVLTLIERRREFALMAAMGSRLRTVASFPWTETAVVLVAGAVLASVLGTLLALMLVTILTHVFDPPPDALAVPWVFFGELVAALLGAGLASGALTVVALHRADVAGSLREN